jgi:16S rRNA G966 N2-methylase RsmD
VFVERAKRTARALKKRLEKLDLAEMPELRVIEADARRAIKQISESGGQKFDLVFLDPPYAEGESRTEREPTLEALFASGILSTSAIVVVEGPTRHPLPPLPGVRVVNQRRYGDTMLTWLEATVAAAE